MDEVERKMVQQESKLLAQFWFLLAQTRRLLALD
jgi:hypothetical protein